MSGGTFGTITFAGARQSVPGGGPGNVTDAESGTFLSGTKVHLGSNAGAKPLLANTDIRLGNFLFDINNGGNKQFFIDPVNRLYKVGDIDGSNNKTYLSINDTLRLVEINSYNANFNFLRMDMIANDYFFGDNNGAGSTRLQIKGSNNTALLQNINVTIGDGDNFFNRTKLNINDATREAYLQGQLIHFGDFENILNSTFLSINTPSPSMYFESTGKLFLLIDAAHGAYQMGDINVLANGSYLKIEDALKEFQCIAAGSVYLDLKGSTSNYKMGGITGAATVSFFEIDDLNAAFYFRSGPGRTFLRCDISSDVYQFGDIDNNASNNYFMADGFNNRAGILLAGNYFLLLDDVNKLYKLGDTNNIGNSTLLTVNDTIARKSVNITNVQEFLNNAAALLGGLVAGDLYRITATDAVAIVH